MLSTNLVWKYSTPVYSKLHYKNTLYSTKALIANNMLSIKFIGTHFSYKLYKENHNK